MLANNNPAPDFELFDTINKKLSLKDLRGKNVIIAFYPADWSPVCGDQIALYNEMTQFFKKFNAVIIGISVDSKWCHAAYKKHRNIEFPLLADFHPPGEVARQFDVFNEKKGTAQRALFVVDEEGIIRWSYLSPIDVNPGAEGIIEALESITQKQKEYV
jgi:peroxiredoxin